MTTYQDSRRFRVPPGARGKNAIIVQLWWIVQGAFFAASPQFMYGWRRFLLRLFGAKIGKDVLFRSSVRVQYPWKLTVGDYSWIGDGSKLYSLAEINIGKNACLALDVFVCTGGHRIDRQTFDLIQNPVVIEDECWIGSDVFIAPGTRIGRGAVIGARSSVLKDVEGGYVYVGTPAKRMKKREMVS